LSKHHLTIDNLESLARLATHQDVYTIVKHSSTHYDLVHFITREPVVKEIPFKLTAERLMAKANTRQFKHSDFYYWQRQCDDYHRLSRDVEFYQHAAGFEDTVRRHVALARLEFADNQLAVIEKILLVDDK
jgi:hypothetical protein